MVVVSVFVLVVCVFVEDPFEDSAVVESEGAAVVVVVVVACGPPDLVFGFDFVFDFGGMVVVG